MTEWFRVLVAVLALAFFAADFGTRTTEYFSRLEPPSPSSGEGQKHHERTGPKEHSDRQIPERIAKDGLPPTITQNNSEHHDGVGPQAENQGEWYSRPDWWVAGFTGSLFLATGALWLATLGMWRTTSRAVINGENALAALERPLFHFIIESTNWDGFSSWAAFFAADPTGLRRPSITYSINNYGRTAGVIDSISIGADYGAEPPHSQTAKPIKLPRNHLLPANGHTVPISLEPIRDVPIDITFGRYDRQVIRFWCFGVIKYRSVGTNPINFETEFLWSYAPAEPIYFFGPHMAGDRNRNT